MIEHSPQAQPASTEPPWTLLLTSHIMQTFAYIPGVRYLPLGIPLLIWYLTK
jgi:hypothetical protein